MPQSGGPHQRPDVTAMGCRDGSSSLAHPILSRASFVNLRTTAESKESFVLIILVYFISTFWLTLFHLLDEQRLI